jgi:xylulokinase
VSRSARQVATLGIDAGTSGCKAVLLADDGAIRSTAWCGYATNHGADGSVTQEPAAWWAALRKVVHDVREQAPEVDVAALAITAPAHNVVLLDARGAVLAPVMLWSDARPAGVAAELRPIIGDRLRLHAFVDLDAAWSLPQLVWLSRTEPDVWQRVRHVLPAKDWLRSQLTGDRLTDPTDAAGTAMYEPVAAGWSTAVLDECGIPPSSLPDVAPSTAVAGRIRPDVAADVGLAGIPVVVGATDTAAELVAVGATRPGDGVVKIATTGTVVVVSDVPRPARGVLVYPHAIAGSWYALTAMNTAGAAYRWLSRVLNRSEPELDTAAAVVPAGADGVTFLPHLAGERCPLWDPHATGTFAGLRAAHGHGHLARAVLEGVAQGLRDCAAHLAHSDAIPRRPPTFTGGGMRSQLWQRITIDVLGGQALIRRPCEPALGASMLAAEAIGAQIDIKRDEEIMLEADASTHATYARLRRRRDALRAALHP